MNQSHIGLLSRRGFTGLLLGGILLAACDKKPAARPAGAPRPPVGAYADGPEGLARLWNDILRACQKDDRERVHDLLASLAFTREELDDLLGSSVAGVVWSRYQAEVASMANTGAVELVAFVYDKKFDEVAVQRVDTLPVAELGATDRAVLKALRRPLPLYTVQLRRKPAPKGLRYEFLIYLSGHWRTGGQLGKLLTEGTAP